MVTFFKDYINHKNHYRFNNCWHIDAPLEKSWNALVNFQEWPVWCESLIYIELLSKSEHLSSGNQIRSVWKGKFPYTIRFDAGIKNMELYSFLSLSVTGDLAGEGKCYLFASEEKTTINFIWDITPTKLWMKMSAPFARAFFIENHNHIINQTATGFARMLER